MHEYVKFQVAPFWWCGNFSAPAEAILTQHAAQSGLTPTDNCLAQWSVFCAVTPDHPLSFALFNQLLDKLTKPLQSGECFTGLMLLRQLPRVVECVLQFCLVNLQ